MKLIMYGVNRDTVSYDDVEKYSLNESMRTNHINDISSFTGVSELVLLTTRNRNEYYLYINEQIFQHGDFLRYLSLHTGKPLEEIILETYSKFNDDVVNHLFSLTSIMSHMPESLNVIEKALSESATHGTVGHILNDLFNSAIRFTLSLYDKTQLFPLLTGEVPNAIEKIRHQCDSLEDLNYLVIGNNDMIDQLVKYIICEPSCYLTILERNEQSKKLFYNIRNWLTLTNNFSWNQHFQSADLNQLVYRLSKADVIIIGPSVKNALLSHELLEDVYEMRPTAKKQLILDFSGAQDETIFSQYQHIKYVQIDDETVSDLPADNNEEAKTFYDEYLTSQTNEFMERFNQLTESNISHMLTKEQNKRQLRNEKKISCKA